MHHLSGLDATFLHLETPEMPMHVGGLQLLELPPGQHAGFTDVIKRHVADRMHLAAIYARKLAPMPFEIANPVWIDDDDVDLDYHIRQLSLPRPGTRAQLEACIARLHANLLDRSRPLWEFYVVTGLASGQLAFYTKIHHAALDGQGAMLLAQSLLDTTAQPRVLEPAPRGDPQATARPEASTLLKAALRDTFSQSLRLIRGVPAGVRVAAGALAANQPGLLARLAAAPRTMLNVSITRRRAFATVTLPQAQLSEAASAFGVTLNDMVLAIVSGALRRYLDEHGDLPDKSLVAAVPVTLRDDGNADMNNQVGMLLLQLASDEDDVALRVQAIAGASSRMKKTAASVKSLMPTQFPSLGLPWLMSALASLYGRARLADSLPPLANVIVSNVRGAPAPMYLAGARMVASYPASIVTHGVALNVTVQSYDGNLDIGMVACRRAMRDIHAFADAVGAAHADLLAAARARKPAARKRKPRAAATLP